MRAALAVMALAGAAAAAPQPLDPSVCAVIADYDARFFQPSLLEQFAAMAFRHEWCEAAGGPCETGALARRDRDFEIAVLAPGMAADDPLRRVIAANLDYAARVIGGVSGLSVTQAAALTPERIDDTAVLLVWSRAEALRALSDPAPAVPRAMLDAIGLGVAAGLPCFVRPAVGADGRVGAGVLFVAADQGSEAVAACVKEELFNYLGLFADPLGDASLFDDPWGRDRDDPDGLLFVGFSIRDYALLKLLYDPTVAPGMPKAEAMARLAARIADACG